MLNMINLYVIDDHFLIIEGLYTSFDPESSEFVVVGGSVTVDEGIKEIAGCQIDIIILDLFIGLTDPCLNLSRIQKNFPHIPVVILSNESCIMWQVEMFRRGIKAFISKTEDKVRLREKLLYVANGEVVMPAEVNRILFSGNESDHIINYFTDSFKIIKYLSEGFSVKEVSCRLKLSPAAIEKKLHTIRKTYHVKSNIELVFKALSRPVAL